MGFNFGAMSEAKKEEVDAKLLRKMRDERRYLNGSLNKILSEARSAAFGGAHAMCIAFKEFLPKTGSDWEQRNLTDVKDICEELARREFYTENRGDILFVCWCEQKHGGPRAADVF